VISWILPWIGHTGIANSEGLLYDFLGFINKGRMGFGNPIKYVPLRGAGAGELDRGIRAANMHFQETGHNLCCNNCHHHVAEALNSMAYRGRRDWSQVSVWWLCLAEGRYFEWAGVVQVYGPLLLGLGIILGCTLAFK
jgi:hypothetical protein